MEDITVISLINMNGKYYVSSKEVAEKFKKKHKNVLRAIDNLQVPDIFRRLNFEPGVEKDVNGFDQRVIYMTRDGFAITALGFNDNGEEEDGERLVMKWKLGFLEAFNKMEAFIREKIPLLEEINRELVEKVKELEKRSLFLPEEKRPHGNKGTVLVPVMVNTIFGTEVEYRRVPKQSENFSELSFKEGELKRLSQLLHGMSKKVEYLSREVALLRRK